MSDYLLKWSSRCYLKKESTLTSWKDLLMISQSDGSRSCPLSFTSKKRVNMKEKLWHNVLSVPWATLVNVTDWESIGEDLGFICLQFLPVATEVCCPRSLFYPHDLLFPHNRRAFHQILSGDNLFLLVRIAFINCDIWKHLLYNCFLTH